MNKNLSSYKDRERLIKKVRGMKEEAWKELNAISGLDPKHENRRKVYDALRDLLLTLDWG